MSKVERYLEDETSWFLPSDIPVDWIEIRYKKPTQNEWRFIYGCEANVKQDEKENA